jgi:hypothetical protein
LKSIANKAMPTFLSLPAVHQEIEKMTAAGDILIGETILSQETTEGLVDGHLVPKELVVTLKADNPEDLTEEAIRNAIPAAVKVIRNGPVIRCVMANRQAVDNLDIGGQAVKLVEYKKPEVKGLVSRLCDVIHKMLVEELPRCKFIHGMFSFCLLTWCFFVFLFVWPFV